MATDHATPTAKDQDVAETGKDHETVHAAKKIDERSKRADPHGVKPAEKAAEHEPTGSPSSDRHKTETAGQS